MKSGYLPNQETSSYHLCTTSGVSGEKRPSPLEEKLARADEAIRRKEQLIQEMRQQVSLVAV